MQNYVFVLKPPKFAIEMFIRWCVFGYPIVLSDCNNMLRRWLMERRNEISAMGVKPTRKVLPLRVVCYMCRELGLDDDDF